MTDTSFTPDDLAEFGRLTAGTCSLSNLRRIDSRLELGRFVKFHGDDKCRAMNDIIMKRDAREAKRAKKKDSEERMIIEDTASDVVAKLRASPTFQIIEAVDVGDGVWAARVRIKDFGRLAIMFDAPADETKKEVKS